MQAIMGLDQYGDTYHDLGPHPRKALVERLGGGRVAKMYVDTKDGATKHIGYVVGRLWVTLYTSERWEIDA